MSVIYYFLVQNPEIMSNKLSQILFLHDFILSQIMKADSKNG